MEPAFQVGALLIFDPERQPRDRSYILVRLEENNRYFFRQLIIDGNDHYLKPLNPDLSLFKMRFLDKKDQVIACLIESRNKLLPEDQLKMLEDI
ncbi:MAG TPA: S24 family peptidase [Gammaproteobacteria bacterium]|nr:S24 family peptidase [Gammaproteobacteria bacterium]